MPGRKVTGPGFVARGAAARISKEKAAVSKNLTKAEKAKQAKRLARAKAITDKDKF